MSSMSIDGEIGAEMPVVDIPVEGNIPPSGIIENFCSAILDGTPLLHPERGNKSVDFHAMHLSA